MKNFHVLLLQNAGKLSAALIDLAGRLLVASEPFRTVWTLHIVRQMMNLEMVLQADFIRGVESRKERTQTPAKKDSCRR